MIKPDQQSEIETSVVTLTPVAAAKVRELLTQEDDQSFGLRIFVAGGGCSGLQYGMTLDEKQEGDTVIIVDRAGKHMELNEVPFDPPPPYTAEQEPPPPYTAEQEPPPPYTPSVPLGDFKVFIDDMSLGYITGSTVDYVDSLMGAGFTVNNPNAVSSCGCGHSFKTAEDSDSQ